MNNNPDQLLRRPESIFILNLLANDLPDYIRYHTIEHTLDVYQRATYLAGKEGISGHDFELLLIAVLYHDSGYLYQRDEHESLSCEIAREHLGGYGYKTPDIEIICGIIMATRLPQNPHTTAEQIICDADLDYLGRDDFFETGHGLYQEMLTAGIVSNEHEWNLKQITFLQKHRFFTKTNRSERDAVKNQNLSILRTKTGIQ